MEADKQDSMTDEQAVSVLGDRNITIGETKAEVIAEIERRGYKVVETGSPYVVQVAPPATYRGTEIFAEPGSTMFLPQSAIQGRPDFTPAEQEERERKALIRALAQAIENVESEYAALKGETT